MNNVVTMQRPVEAQLNPLGWVKNLFEKCTKDQDELMKKKIDFLYKNTYKFYLDLYLTGTKQNNSLDFHPALYKSGATKSVAATKSAMECMISVIKEGRVNECYTKLTEHLKSKKVK